MYRQFRRWTLAGVWDVILEALNETGGTGHDSVQMIDSTISTQPRAKKGDQDQGLGRPRGGFSTKIHLRSNALGLPVAVTLSDGQASDVKGYAPVMDEPGPQPRVLLADKGYDADFTLADLSGGGL